LITVYIERDNVEFDHFCNVKKGLLINTGSVFLIQVGYITP